MKNIINKKLWYALVSTLILTALLIPAGFVFAGSQMLPWGVDRIDAEQVHPLTKGAGVRIAVLDSGVDLDHPDLSLAGSVSVISGLPGVDDDFGHGTLVAGIIAALDNDIGTIGVAPEAEIYSVRILNEYGSAAMITIQNGVEWAIQNQMDIINLSIGSTMEWPTSVQDVLKRAYDAGILIIAGAGNGGTSAGDTSCIWAPARYPSVMAVGVTDENDKRVSSSSTGVALEVMAPGNNAYSTARGGGYGTLSETSAASAYVTGVAALVMSVSGLSATEVRQVLKDTATDLGTPGWDNQYGYGLVNALSAVTVAKNMSPKVVTTSTALEQGVTTTTEAVVSNEPASADIVMLEQAVVTNVVEPVENENPALEQGVTATTEAVVSNEPASTPVADMTTPVTTIELNGTQGNPGFYRSDVQIILTARDDDGGSGVANTEYSLDGGNTWKLYSAPFAMVEESKIQILARSTDNVGNTELRPVQMDFVIDRSAPQVTVSIQPGQIVKVKNGSMIAVDYTLDIMDIGSTDTTIVDATLEDEYGELTQPLDASVSGKATIEAWCDGKDKDGRIYTFSFTVADMAGNQAAGSSTFMVLHNR